MTQVDVVYRYGAAPTESAALAIGRLREVYGIRGLHFDELDRTVRIEYDSTRFTEPVVHQLLRRAGLDTLERVLQYTPPAPPAAPVEAAPAVVPVKA